MENYLNSSRHLPFFTLHPPPSTLHPPLIGQKHFLFEEIDSTNTRALQYTNDASLDGAIFQARTQSAGRGQYDRVWLDRPGDSILLSVLLFPPPSVRRPALLTAMAAVSVAEAVEQMIGLSAQIKWPNDVLLKDRKVCGILIESKATLDGQLAVVCGIGLNLNQSQEDFERSGLLEATSLRIEADDARFELDSATKILLQRLDSNYKYLCESGFESLEARWIQRLEVLHRIVRIELRDGKILTGRLNRLSFEEISVRDDNGEVHSLKPEAIRQLKAIV